MSPPADHEFMPQRRPRLLIVDDNKDIVLTLKALLEDDGYQIRCAYSGRDALIELAEFDPDAVIIDIGLPELTGWDFARAVRRISDSADRPLLIAISGQFTKGADAVLSRIAGFNHFLPKPFDIAELIRLLASTND